MSKSLNNIVIVHNYQMEVGKIGLVILIVLLVAYSPVGAQSSDNSGLLNDQIDRFMERVEAGEALTHSEIERLGYLHYQRGLTYKSLYLFSLDASLRALENLESNYGVSTDFHFYDLLRIRKHYFSNNSSSANVILQNNSGNEHFTHWQFAETEAADITTKNQVVASWYSNPERGMVCEKISEDKLKEFCNVLNYTPSDLNQYLQREKEIRGFLPDSRDALINYHHTELIGYVDNFHAHWLYDFSVSYWLFDKAGSSQRVFPLFEMRNWSTVASIEENSGGARNNTVKEISQILTTDRALDDLSAFRNLLDFSIKDNRSRWIFTVNSLLEGVSTEVIHEHLIESGYRQIFNQRNTGQSIQIAEILIRAQKTNSAKDIISRYLTQSGSYNLRSYGAHRLALSAHFNFISGGVGGENVAKSQLSEFLQHFPSIMPLYLLVQLATERDAGNPNDFIQTN